MIADGKSPSSANWLQEHQVDGTTITIGAITILIFPLTLPSAGPHDGNL